MQATFCIIGSQSLLHVGALSVRLSEGSPVLIAACSVRSNYLLYIVVVSIAVLYPPILCPVVREWWAGAYCMWEKSVGLSKSGLSWASCFLILFIKGRLVCPLYIHYKEFPR